MYHNYGTEYVPLSCGVPSTVVDVESNITSGYLYRESNDYILWGQDVAYPPTQLNRGTQYYFYKCDTPSASGLNLESNKGTRFYYTSAFNCVPFCDGL